MPFFFQIIDFILFTQSLSCKFFILFFSNLYVFRGCNLFNPEMLGISGVVAECLIEENKERRRRKKSFIQINNDIYKYPQEKNKMRWQDIKAKGEVKDYFAKMK